MTKRLRVAPVMLLLAITGVVVGAGADVGCGQSVATCDSDCALPNAPNDCVAACTAAETACTTTCSADFQSYLTCIGNAGTFRAVDDLCADEAIAAHVRGSDLEPVVDGGPNPGDAGPEAAADTGLPMSCSAATCANVCVGAADVGCVMGCEANQSACSAMATQFQAVLTCLCEAGGLGGTSPQADMCTAELQSLNSACEGIGVDAATH